MDSCNFIHFMGPAEGDGNDGDLMMDNAFFLLRGFWGEKVEPKLVRSVRRGQHIFAYSSLWLAFSVTRD